MLILSLVTVLLLEATKLLSCYVHLLDLQGHINVLMLTLYFFCIFTYILHVQFITR